MKVATTVLSLMALTDAKVVQDNNICTAYDTCAELRSCCVTVAETKGGNAASQVNGVCVKDGTKVGTQIAVTHETTVAIKFGWYDTKAFTINPCVSRWVMNGA